MSHALELHDVTFCYRRHPAVHHLSGRFEAGSLTAVVGPNGAGKSTLLKGLVGVLRPSEGRIRRHGLRRRDIAYLPQQAEIDRRFPLTVGDVVAMGHWRRIGLFGGMGQGLRRQVDEALAAVSLDGFRARTVDSLSAGQLQRVLFARMLLQDAPVILLDEPFNAIDARTTADLLGVVRRWHEQHKTVIAVLHDPQLVCTHFPRALLLAREPLAWGETDDVMRAENLLRARQMAEAWDEDAARCNRSRSAA